MTQESSRNNKERPSRAGIEAALVRVENAVRRTPLLQVADRVWLKAESLQHGGAFKLRGAYNRLAQLGAAERARGVVAFSSGNHAQGVALAARWLGMPATIVMPADAPAVKLANTAALGAEIVRYDRATESRERIAADLARARGAVLVPSFDDRDVVEGQGTLGLEVAVQLGHAPARLVVPCGGGGLAAGVALALPETQVVVAEPAGWDDMGRGLAAGEIMEVAADAPATACDALQTRRVAAITFDALHAAGATATWATEAEIRAAMRLAFGWGLVLEPGGAVALAAWAAGRIPPADGDTVLVASGRNVDPAQFAAVLAGD